MSTSCSFDRETVFGPGVDACRGRFDFTLFFSETFLQIVPSSVFLVLLGLRFWSVTRRRPRVISIGTLYYLKVATLAIFSVLHLTILVLISLPENQKTDASVAAAVLSLLAALALVGISHFDHFYSYRPSVLNGFYLFITLLLRISTVRTYWLLEDKHAIAYTSLAALVLQSLALVLENWNKGPWVIANEDETIPVEETTGFLSQSLFLWVNQLFLTGYKRPLQIEDLRSMIDRRLYSGKVSTSFGPIQTLHDYGPFGLIGTCIRCLGLQFFFPAIPRLCLTGFTFSQPFLTSALTSYLANPTSTPFNSQFGLIGASALVYSGIAISNAWYHQLALRSSVQIWTGLVGAVGSKLLRVPHEKGVEAKILTLVINDVYRIHLASAILHEFWIAPIEVALGIWLLWRHVGPPSLAMIGIALASMSVAALIGSRMGGYSAKWLAATEKRIAATTGMLSSLKAIKMMGESKMMSTTIEQLRVLEFEASKIFRTLLAGSVLTSFSTLILSPVAVFGAYIGYTNTSSSDPSKRFDASTMFSSLILITLVASPLIMLFQAIPNLGQAIGCAHRVGEFLQKEETTRRETGKHSAKHDGSNETDVPAVVIKDADIGWEDQQPLIKNLHLVIPRGKHVAITGPPGSGKSLLLMAILGEITPKSGSVDIPGDLSIGYCAQNAWIENLSAKDNIFRGGVSDDPVWKDEVIDACAVRGVINGSGQGSTVGSGGARLSGGEKQRLALARAVACRPSILILDDALSAVDRPTKRRILDRLFGSAGLAVELGITVIQVVQDGLTAKYADTALRLDEGTLMPYQFPSQTQATQDADHVAEQDRAESEPEKSIGESVNQEVDHADPSSISDREVYRVYFQAIGNFHTAILVANLVAFAFMYRFPDVWTRWWTEDSSLPSPTKPVGYWIGLYACWSVLALVTILIGIGHLLLKIAPKSGINLHMTLLRTVLTARWIFISTIDTGNILNRFNQDLMLVDLKLPLDLLNAASIALLTLVQTILIATAALPVLAVLPVLAIIVWALQHVYLRTSKRLRQLDLDAKGELHTRITETYTGVHTVRAHGWSRLMTDIFQSRLDRATDPLYLLGTVQNWLSLVVNLVVAGLGVVVTAVAVSSSSTGAGAIGVAMLNLAMLGESLANLLTSWTALETSLGAIARIRAFEGGVPPERDIAEKPPLPPDWPSQGELSLDGVWATYQNLEDGDKKGEKTNWSLRDVSFTIQPGERIAVCGPSGSGKSTLLLVLLGLVDTHSGSIRLDGIETSTLPKDFLRSKYFVISQDGMPHTGSARAALDPEGCHSEQAIEDVLRECAVLENVSAGGGIDGQLADMSFSVGEAQLFTLARTILRAQGAHGGVVLFDEATSSLDVATERKIMDLLAEKFRGRTLISVLHRLETALEYDRVLVLEEGRIVSFDTPDDTLKSVDLFRSVRPRDI
ncbi:P-loop containing nucleoside triphosphate hydrolase protein [Echria macrotheca]|uniref:P-loop containing nucleoside triphosphate hydrolase protein n=1 Tax=Echria macrotheca TaxID=438768 RepID=A0AAJ0BH43_9PEZI|nr:P-loop containing nucleoside triphosphate hydrolase protein [Echria macrotheca]